MAQPQIRFKRVHSPAFADGELDRGKSYLERTEVFEFTTSGSGYTDFLFVPAGTYIEKATLLITAALDTGALLDLGTDGNEDALIDNTDITEDAVGVATSETTAPDGLYFEDDDYLRLTVGNDNSQGTVIVKLRFWDFTAIATQGYHSDFFESGFTIE